MKLTHHLGQRIVDWLRISFNIDASVTDSCARIIASTDPAFVGRTDAVARRTIASGGCDAELAGSSLPIVYANTIIGAIVLGDPSPRHREIALVAKTLAELMIRQMTIRYPCVQRRWARARFLYDLLHGQLENTPDDVEQEAAVLGIDLTIPRIVILIDAKPVIERCANCDSADAALPLIGQMLRVEHSQIDLIERACRTIAAGDADISTCIGDRWLALLAATDRGMGGSQRPLDQDVQRFLDELACSTGVTTSAGIGHAYSSWPALAQSFVDARFALEMGTRLHGAGHVFRLEALGLAGFIAHDDQRIKDALALRLIGSISSEPDLLATLEAFLHAHLSPSLAAEMLHIHRHTLTYRLAKIAQLSGRDPRRFEDAAQLYAALLLWNLSGRSHLVGQTAKK